jgi:RNA polymerase-interacting CarD/CdnL/TRCF family regulator
LSFQIGDKVIHSVQGFGEIINIESKEISGKSSLYYVVKTRDLILWVPISSNNNSSLRYPTRRVNFSALIDILRSHNNPFSKFRNERKSQINTMLTSGGTESICRLIRDLSFYRKTQKLNDTDTYIFKSAVNKLIDEWQYAMSISTEQAIVELNSLLDESYAASIHKG